MAYQMNKDTKILLVLLAVVLLCSAKLFKDYLYRNRYIEGMTLVSQESSVQLRRPDTAGSSVNADIMFTLTLGGELPTTAGTLSVAWTGTGAGDVTFPTTAGNYTATASGYTIAPPTSASASPVTFGAVSPKIPSGTQIKITIKGVTIYSKSTTDITKINVTVSAGSDTTSGIAVSILPFVSTGQAAGASTYTASASASVSEIQETIKSINERINAIGTDPAGAKEVANLQKASSALIALLASTYGTIKEAGQVFESGALYEAQKTAIDFISKEKTRAASNAAALSDDNINKRRMAQINTYYTRNYEANTEVMKNVIYISVALIILAVLRKKELIPGSISTLGVIFILTMGGIVIGKQIFDIMRRNDHDFDKYDWEFNENQMNQQKLVQTASDPTSLSGLYGPCYGSSCCDVGTTWNDDVRKCITSANIVSGTAAWTAPTPGSTTGSLTIKLNVLTALVGSDTITITLPSGLFKGSPALATHSQLTGTTLSTTSNTLTVTSPGIDAKATVKDIVITGLSVNDSSSSLTKQLKVKTSKDTNDVAINIFNM